MNRTIRGGIEPMEKTISASELKNSLGAVIREVRQDDEIRVIEQRGVPAAAIISIDDLRLLREAKEEKRRTELLEELRQLTARLEEQQRGMSPDEADRMVEELSDAVMDAVVEKARHRFEQFS
jgi:prevent-host-death family protein